MRASIAPNGELRLSVPSYAPIFVVKRMIQASRTDLRLLFANQPTVTLHDGMQIGKSHTLVVKNAQQPSIKRQSLQLIVTLAPGDTLASQDVIQEVRSQMRLILRKEAKAHLPKRIHYLATKYGYDYSSLRFTHASSRWGSCNSKKAISLNIALMGLPFELIDYVLLHELAHTKHLNHSAEFWQTVGGTDLNYLTHKKQLKSYNPSI